MRVTILIASGCDPQYEKPHPAKILAYVHQWDQNFSRKFIETSLTKKKILETTLMFIDWNNRYQIVVYHSNK